MILFDELEKAHPDVLNVLLQLLDDGRLTDSQGRIVDFKNTAIIMTSNVGSQYYASEFSRKETGVKVFETLRKVFRPEFLNRIDETIIFNKLSKRDIFHIVNREVHELGHKLSERGINLSISQSAREHLAELGFSPDYGARPLKRFIQREIEDPLALKILKVSFLKNQI